MTHKSSSRQGSGGGKIQTLELTAPRALTAGNEYFLTSEGSLVTQQEISPLVAAPLVGSNLPNNNANYCFIGSTADPVFINMDYASKGIVSMPVVRVPLAGNFEMYLSKPENSTPSRLVHCVVYNTETGDRVAEHLFQLGAGNGTSMPRSAHYAIAPAGTNKWCVLYEYTTNGITYQNRVGEYTFNGTDTVTFAWKTAIGADIISQTAFCGQGRGVSDGKVAISRNGVYSIINLIANTINSAAGFTTNHQVEGQYGLSFGAANSISVTNYETNGSSSFTATGATLLDGDVGVKLTPTVYLQGLSLSNSAANQLRLVVFNPTYTSAVVTLLTHPRLQELPYPTVVQPRSGVLDFLIVDSYQSTGAQSNESGNALTFSINSAGAITKAPKTVLLDANTFRFCRTFNIVPNEPAKLDQPVWHIQWRQQLSTVATPDSAAYLIVKFRPDFYIGQFRPKYIGRALATVAQGALATFAASPQLLAVDPAQTAFQRVGRVIKVNDLQGFFLDYQVAQFGLTLTAGGGTQPNPGNTAIDSTGFNYPWVVGVQSPAESGKLSLVGWNTTQSSTQCQALVVTPVSVSSIQLSGSAALAFALEAAFSGFMIAAFRLDDIGGSTQITATLMIEAEEADYV